VSGLSYTAIDGRGRRCRGHSGEPTEAALRERLRADGLFLVECAASGPSAESSGRLPRHELLLASRTLGSLLKAGMSLSRALTVTRQLSGPRAAAVLKRVQHRVERGERLAMAMRTEGHFPAAYIGLLHGGEAAGRLAEAFERNTRYLEIEELHRRRLVSAAAYPIVLTCAGAVCVLVLALVVLPSFAGILADSGEALPPLPAALLGASGWLTRHKAVLTAVLLLLLAGGAYAAATEYGRQAIARLAVAAPLVGRFRRAVLGARFARLLGTLVGSGLPLLSSLEVIRQSIADGVAAAAVQRTAERVRRGSGLHDALSAETVFPPILLHLVAAGEQSGSLAAFLDKGASELEDETERNLQRLSALAEPVLVIAFGAALGVVALALFQAIQATNAGVLG
jgi:general secretion pathway protein F